MRAVELRIVFEDDEGKTYVETYEGTAAETAFRDLSVVEMERQNLGLHGPHQDVPRVGPVLRKVTEVEGRLVDREFHFDEALVAFPREPDGTMRCRGIDEHLFPDGVAAKYDDEKDDYAGPLYRFRIDVTAVPVPEKESG